MQEALEEIEYVTGEPTRSGARYARGMGIPRRSQLRYVEIGNEDKFDRAKTYDGRYAQFYKAIKAKYPEHSGHRDYSGQGHHARYHR